MSNQIYSNNRAKYYEHPGANVRIVAGPLNTLVVIDPATTLPALIFNDTTTTTSYAQPISPLPPTVIDNAGIIRFNESGIYSLNFIISMRAVVNYDIRFIIKLILNNDEGVADAIIGELRETQPTIATNDTPHITSLSYVGYFAKSSRLNLAIVNLSEEELNVIGIVRQESIFSIVKIY